MVLGQKYELGTAATAKIINLWSKGLTFFFQSLHHYSILYKTVYLVTISCISHLDELHQEHFADSLEDPM